MAIARTINMDTAKKLSSVFILFIEKARGSIEISHFCFLFDYISTCFLNQRYFYRYDPCTMYVSFLVSPKWLRSSLERNNYAILPKSISGFMEISVTALRNTVTRESTVFRITQL